MVFPFARHHFPGESRVLPPGQEQIDTYVLGSPFLRCRLHQPDKTRLGCGISGLPNRSVTSRMRAYDDNRAAALCEKGRAHRTQAVKRAGEVRRHHVDPNFHTLFEYEAAPTNSGITHKNGRRRDILAERVYHLPVGVGISNIRVITRTGTACPFNLSERRFGARLLAMVMQPDKPSGLAKDHADGTADSAGGPCHEDSLSRKGSIGW